MIQSTLNSPQCPKYVLVTAAYNEAKFIKRALESTIAQTLLPERWVIVSDGSTDGTDDIVRSYATNHHFIHLVRITEEHPRNFAAQVFALQTACNHLLDTDYDFIGNLDADVAMDPTYFASLFQRFRADDRLGLAGGYIFEQSGPQFRNRPSNSESSVAHATQMFRRECFRHVGGYQALKYGGPDWLAEIRARLGGWSVRSFPDLPVYHYRPTTSAEGMFRACWRQGYMDHCMGSLFSFELMKCGRRLFDRPFLIGSLARLTAFCAAKFGDEPLLVSGEVASYLQNEQRARVREFFKRVAGPNLQKEQP